MHVLDVCQGLAVLVETRHQLIIFDTGPAWSESFEAGGGLLVLYMAGAGLPDPALIIVSHGDRDHAGGLSGLLARYPHTPVLSGEPERLPAASRARLCSPGQHWQVDGIGFAFIHSGYAARAGNDSSCVLKVSAGEHHILLPGDAGRNEERRMLLSHDQALAADVLLVPHHGSDSSSSPAFINRVKPGLAIVSNGYRNRYGHPSDRVMARYLNRGVPVLETAREGAIVFMLDTGGVSDPRSWRRQSPQVWRSVNFN